MKNLIVLFADIAGTIFNNANDIDALIPQSIMYQIEKHPNRFDLGFCGIFYPYNEESISTNNYPKNVQNINNIYILIVDRYPYDLTTRCNSYDVIKYLKLVLSSKNNTDDDLNKVKIFLPKMEETLFEETKFQTELIKVHKNAQIEVI